MARFTSYGVCALCSRHTSKAGMTRHLKTCPANHDASRGEPARLLRLRAEDAWTPFFWMDLEMKAGAKLEGRNNSPVLDDDMQTTVPGLYVAGTAAAGTQVSFRLFIENCHEHVRKIAAVITGNPNAGVFKPTGNVTQGLKQMPES